MRVLALIAAFLFSLMAAPAFAHPVLMISIDGLRPLDVLDASARGLKLPVLSGLVREGSAATGVRNALPTVTYPNHTTLITGVWPAVHGVSNNTVFDPLQKNLGGWYWYASDIKVPTLWSAVHGAGGKMASLGWPVSVGSPDIDYDIPEYWRARIPEDLKLVAPLCTPGLWTSITAQSGVTLADTFSEQPSGDEAKAKAAAAIYALYKPRLFTLHLASLDHAQHVYGPGTPDAHAVLERIDAAVGGLIAAARKAEPNLIVAIVSDHGFAPVQHDANLGVAFVKAGLITLDDKGMPVAWEAEPWSAGGSAAVVLARPNDAALARKVADLLATLARDPNSGVGRVIDKQQIEAMGGAVEASFFIDARLGYNFGSKLTGRYLTPGSVRGTHGYFPDHPEMRATLILQGPHIPVGRSLGEVDMRDVAPTIAKLTHVTLPTAAGKPLF